MRVGTYTVAYRPFVGVEGCPWVISSADGEILENETTELRAAHWASLRYKADLIREIVQALEAFPPGLAKLEEIRDLAVG